MRENKYRIWVVIMGVFLFFAACSVKSDYKTLSFFFDGIPNPEAMHEAYIADSLSSLALHTSDSTLLRTQTDQQQLYLHPPYLEKKCADCHNQGRMGSLNQAMPELCYGCHVDFSTQYSKEHGPSAGGYCTQCHHPHKAQDKQLLHKKGQNLCLQCHDAESLNENPFHDINLDTDCLSCHDPHGSNNHSLLKKGLCYECHEDYNEVYTVVHGPVAAGECSTCHVAHRSGRSQLLIYPGRKLCLFCHDAAQVKAQAHHEDIEDASCTECHNPHGGEDRLMFN